MRHLHYRRSTQTHTMPAIRDAISKLHLKVQKAKDQGSNSKSSLSNRNHKSEHNGDKAIRGGLESDVKRKIAQLETTERERQWFLGQNI
jgi:hypothetical protein